MKVLQVINNLQRAAGTSVFCVEAADHLIDINVESELVVSSFDPDDFLLPLKCDEPKVIKSFEQQYSDFDIIHSHGLWDLLPHKAVRFGVRKNIPICTSPHGMLTPWALNNRKWKKKLAMMLYQWRDLKSASLLHATAEGEVDNIRRLGLRQPVVIAPLGVNLLDLSLKQKSRSGAHDPRKVILFISRIHPIKGLFNLLDAWSVIRDKNWRIIIAGPDDQGHLNELKDKTVQLGIAEDVSFISTVYGAEKDRLYFGADLFVLPSYSENFGVVVPEALAAGVPVITTKGTPWKVLEGSNISEKCGWWIDIGVEPLVKALREAMLLSDAERAALGANGRMLVEERYSWSPIAKDLKSAYEWLLGKGSKPDCVVEG